MQRANNGSWWQNGQLSCFSGIIYKFSLELCSACQRGPFGEAELSSGGERKTSCLQGLGDQAQRPLGTSLRSAKVGDQVTINDLLFGAVSKHIEQLILGGGRRSFYSVFANFRGANASVVADFSLHEITDRGGVGQRFPGTRHHAVPPPSTVEVRTSGAQTRVKHNKLIKDR